MYNHVITFHHGSSHFLHPHSSPSDVRVSPPFEVTVLPQAMIVSSLAWCVAMAIVALYCSSLVWYVVRAGCRLSTRSSTPWCTCTHLPKHDRKVSEHCEWFTSRSSADRLSSIDRSPSTNLFFFAAKTLVTFPFSTSKDRLPLIYHLHASTCALHVNGEPIMHCYVFLPSSPRL